MAAGMALLLALAATPGSSIVTPEGSGPVSLAVIVVPPGGNYLQALSFPPSADRPGGEAASLVEHRGTFVGRVLAGPGVPGRITIRQLYPEMASFRIAAIRRLAIVERTSSGYWFVQWQTEIHGSRACLDAAAVAHFRIVVPRRPPDRRGNICFHL